MTSRYDAVAVRKWTDRDGVEQSSFTNIGVAWPFKEGKDGFSLKLHCLPAPEEGEYTVLLFPPKPRDDDQPQRQPERQQQGSYGAAKDRSARTAARAPAFDSGGMDDDIPF